MITPDKAGLLIFDLDGTISVTTKPVYEAVKEAFSGLGMKLAMTETEMEQYFGVPSADFYQAVIPPDSPVSWQEMRERIHLAQEPAFRAFGKTYPDVLSTLVKLRNRGYKLVLYSNSTADYFNTVCSSLQLSDYFDYAESIGQHGLTKPQLVRKIKMKFGNPDTAVIGDRLSDIEAARENNALSVGVLYGYGQKEPERADITINNFSDLVSIFDRRTVIFEKILQDGNRKKQENRPLIIGITGIDGSGKTEFTKGFSEYLGNHSLPVQVIHIDDFHNPRTVRYAGNDQADNYYNRSFNVTSLAEDLLIPARDKSDFTTELTHLDLETDRYDIQKKYIFTPNTVVLLEGVFLLRKELSPYIDYMVFLDISFDRSKTRARLRDSEAVLEKYDTKYLPAQRQYLGEFPPENNAEMIINNSDWENPVIIMNS